MIGNGLNVFTFNIARKCLQKQLIIQTSERQTRKSKPNTVCILNQYTSDSSNNNRITSFSSDHVVMYTAVSYYVPCASNTNAQR